MNKDHIMIKDKDYIVPTYARYELAVEKGNGAVCVDTEGKEYIDFTAGIGVNSLGFCDSGWVEAVTSQLNKIQHVSNLYYTQPQLEVAEQLIKKTGLKKAFFGNSGAEANEAAIKIARKYGTVVKGNKSNNIITLENSFHGRTVATITATGQKHYHEFFTPFPEGFKYCEANNISQLESLIDEETCAIMIELIQGEGGVIELEAEFAKAAAKLCSDNNMLLILDEVQTGIGRTGKLFAYQHYDIHPDIVTFAKGIGGGLPIGGVLLSEKCCDTLQPGDHGTTYGGNPAACAGAAYVLNKMDDDFLTEVSEKGEYIAKQLITYKNVKSVSGRGMMIGIEVEGIEASKVVSECLKSGLMILTAKNKVRLLPPLTITYKELDKGLQILKKVLESTE